MGQQGITLKIDPAQMKQTAQIFDAQLTIIDNCLKSIRDDATALKGVWEGESATAYQTVMEKLNENSPKIVSILEEYVQDLNTIASQFTSDEQKHKVVIEELPSDVFGV